MGRVPHTRRCQTNTFHFCYINVGDGIEFHHLSSVVCWVDLISVTQCVVWRVSPSSYPNDTHISHTPPSAGCCPQAHLPRPDTIRCPVELSTNLHQVSQALTRVFTLHTCWKHFLALSQLGIYKDTIYAEKAIKHKEDVFYLIRTDCTWWMVWLAQILKATLQLWPPYRQAPNFTSTYHV